jgi:hypothetical protein
MVLPGDSAGLRAPGTSSDELPSEAVAEVLRQAQRAGARNGAGEERLGSRAQAAQSFDASLPDYLRQRTNWGRVLTWLVVGAAVVVWGVLLVNNSPLRNGTQVARGPAAPGQGLPAGGGPEIPADLVPPQGEPPVSDAADGDAVASAADKVPGDTVAASTTPGREAADDTEPPADAADDEESPAGRRKPLLEPEQADEPADTAKPRSKPADQVASASGKSDSPPADAPATAPAKYISPEGVVLNYVARDEKWFVLPRRALVHPGDRLAVPEPFECALEIDEGRAVATLLGRTSARMLGPNDGGSTGIELFRGQLVVRTTVSPDEGAKPVELGVAISGGLWRLSLEPGSVAGIEVTLREPTRFEQDAAAVGYAGAIYIASGNVAVTDPAGEVSAIAGPGWLRLPPGSQRDPLVTLPRWLGAPTVTGAARQTARQFEKKFTLSESVDLSLPVVAEDPNPMLARLGTECLGLLDAYGVLVGVLRRSQHEEARKAAISAMRAWLPLDPAHREQLKAELASNYTPEDASAVYRLLWGFDEDDARDNGTSVELLDWMAHSEVSIRELAFYHVSRLTGKSYDYRPNGNPLQLQSALNRWRQHFTKTSKDGALLPPKKPQ